VDIVEKGPSSKITELGKSNVDMARNVIVNGLAFARHCSSAQVFVAFQRLALNAITFSEWQVIALGK
jgi:hypothetical protein